MKALVLLAALLMPSLALAQAVTAVDVSDLKEGESLVVTKKAGVITVRPLLWAGNGPTPTPVPPPTDLTPRAKAIQAEAIKVGDPTTAKELAETLRMVAKIGKDAKDAPTLQAMAKFAMDTTLGPVKAPAWQKTRDELARQWGQVPAAGGVPAYCTLLGEAADGLDAVDLLKAISPEMKKWIWEVLVPLLMKYFLGM